MTQKSQASLGMGRDQACTRRNSTWKFYYGNIGKHRWWRSNNCKIFQYGHNGRLGASSLKLTSRFLITQIISRSEKYEFEDQRWNSVQNSRKVIEIYFLQTTMGNDLELSDGKLCDLGFSFLIHFPNSQASCILGWDPYFDKRVSLLQIYSPKLFTCVIPGTYWLIGFLQKKGFWFLFFASGYFFSDGKFEGKHMIGIAGCDAVVGTVRSPSSCCANFR